MTDLLRAAQALSALDPRDTYCSRSSPKRITSTAVREARLQWALTDAITKAVCKGLHEHARKLTADRNEAAYRERVARRQLKRLHLFGACTVRGCVYGACGRSAGGGPRDRDPPEGARMSTDETTYGKPEPKMEGQRSCRACGRMIRFAKSPTGKPIPLSRVSVVYMVDSDDNAVPFYGDGPETTVDLYISHFVDCPQAARFSKGGR